MVIIRKNCWSFLSCALVLAAVGCGSSDQVEEVPKPSADAAGKFQTGEPQGASQAGPSGAPADTGIGQ